MRATQISGSEIKNNPKVQETTIPLQHRHPVSSAGAAKRGSILKVRKKGFWIMALQIFRYTWAVSVIFCNMLSINGALSPHFQKDTAARRMGRPTEYILLRLQSSCNPWTWEKECVLNDRPIVGTNDQFHGVMLKVFVSMICRSFSGRIVW